MPWAAAAAVVGAGVAASASNKASKAQQGSADAANQTQSDMYYQNREDQEPWRQAGRIALNQLVGGIGGDLSKEKSEENFDAAAYLKANPDVAAYAASNGKDPWTGHPMDPTNFAISHYFNQGVKEGRAFTGRASEAVPSGPGGVQPGMVNDFNRRFGLEDFKQDPGYAFGMQQGMRAVDNSASARGGIGGAALKAGTRYAQDYAGTKYNESFNRWNTETTGAYNRLANIAGLGQQAVSQVGSSGANAANQMGSNMIGAGNAGAANALNQGNIYGNALGQLGAYGKRQWGGGGGGGYTNTRGYDPYSNPMYFGGGEGE